MQRFLFDRLCDPLVKDPLSVQSRLSQLRISIEQELQRLVSNRSYFNGLHERYQDEQTTLNFGIDCLVDFASNFADTYLISEQIVKAIRQYEPRLHSPEVSLIPTNDPLAPASLQIKGVIKVESVMQNFSTAVRLQND